MKLNLTVNGVDQQIEILSPAPACRFRLGEGAERTADVALPAPGVYSKRPRSSAPPAAPANTNARWESSICR